MMALRDFIDLRHQLCLVADDLDWGMLEAELGKYYCDDNGCPGKPIRLMVGLLYLKSVYELSDEDVLSSLKENPYWQYFCGYVYFQKGIDLDSSSLTRFRKRIGEAGLDLLNKAILDRAIDHKYLKSRQLLRVNIDTTVMSKDIKYPTDVDLYYDMLRVLVRKARSEGIELRQSYKRVSKEELLYYKRDAHRRQFKKAARHKRKLRTYLGRVTREIERKLEEPDEEWTKLLLLSKRILSQTKDSHDKVYSVFEPHVYCVNKGKSSPKYEFGCKVAVVTTIKDSWVVGVHTMVKNEHDSKALEPALESMKVFTGHLPDYAVVDRGCRGRAMIGETEIILPKPKRDLSEKVFEWVKQRSRIEAVISHLKNDHQMGRNLLKGVIGDLLNPKLSVIGWNLKKLMRKLLFVLKIILRILRFEAPNLEISISLQPLTS